MTTTVAGGSKIFDAFKALGLHSSHLGHVTRYHQRHEESYVITAVGDVFHTYNCSKFGLCQVSNRHESDIECIAADAFLVYTACGNVVYAYQHNKHVKQTYHGHRKPVHLLLPFGKHLITVDQSSNVRVWHIESGEEFLSIEFSSQTFHITALLHPSTYVNKVLFGSKQGKLQLWNISRNKLVYEFKESKSSPVKTLEQAPAVDVVAIGYESGDIVLYNLRMDVLIMELVQHYGAVTAISFRTDGETIMATGTLSGHICLWDLEEKRLTSLLEDAHSSPVAGLTFLSNQALLISNSVDNSLKMWAFDKNNGDGNLLRERGGHRSSITKVRFYKDTSILSAGNDSTLRLFSSTHPRKDKNLGQASLNRKKARKQSVKLDDGKLPPIVDFAIESAREGQWDGVIAIHHRHPMATTWNVQNGRMGSHKFLHENTSFTKSDNRFRMQKCFVSSVASTACGNFCLVGYNTGHLDLYNIQSGISRGHYFDRSLGQKLAKAHSAVVKGIAIDALNQMTISIGLEGVVKFWRFKEKSLIETTQINVTPSSVELHRGSGMLAIVCDDFSLLVIDIETRKTVRRFSGHSGRINDMTWSADAHWIVTASADCTVRTWDLPSASMVDCFMLDSAVTSLSLSPTSDLLATTHADDVGIYLWSNKSLYSPVFLNALPNSYHPEEVVELPVTLPSTDEEVADVEDKDAVEPDQPNDMMNQLETDLITLSNMPYSKWANVLKLDVIRQRNKPKEPPKAPVNAPFFLPTSSSLNPDFLVEKEAKDHSSKLITTKPLQQFSQFALALLNAEGNYGEVLTTLNKMTLSAVDTEIRTLSPDNGGSAGLMETFLDFVEHHVDSKRDFELIQAYFSMFLTVHTETLANMTNIEDKLSELSRKLDQDRRELSELLNQNMCIVNFIKSATL
ncbi:unnamed protein product [Clavelina lepadiformis]|uniref:Small-subunit processome Utp21 domain-containing protein n=1 Tax=Clavelina lepadiformis TaxID=159417 RepID=A0ABP0GJB2_CLALP